MDYYNTNSEPDVSALPKTLYRGVTIPVSKLTDSILVDDIRPGSEPSIDTTGRTTVMDGNEYGVYMTDNAHMSEVAYATPRGGETIPDSPSFNWKGATQSRVQIPRVGVLYQIDTEGLNIKRPHITGGLRGVYNNGFSGDEWIVDGDKHVVPASNVKVAKFKLGSDILHPAMEFDGGGDSAKALRDLQAEIDKRVPRLLNVAKVIEALPESSRNSPTLVGRAVDGFKNQGFVVAREPDGLLLGSNTTINNSGDVSRAGGLEKTIPKSDLTGLVYHGSPNSFQEFDGARVKENGLWFTENRGKANIYAKPINDSFGDQPSPPGEGQVRMARLNIGKPYITSDPGYPKSASGIASLKSQGYDGIIYDPGDGHPKEYVVFDKEQVHSPWATGSVEEASTTVSDVSTSDPGIKTGKSTSATKLAQKIGAAVDPEGKLPSVELIPDPTAITPRGKLVPRKMIIMHDGNEIGRATLVTDEANKTRWFNGIKVADDLKGKGFGSASYLAAIKQSVSDGYTFRTHDWSQTPEAKAVWDRLAKSGVASEVEAFQPDGKGKFTGHFEVKSTPSSEGLVLHHGGLPDNATRDTIDLDRLGAQQNKLGRSYGGFYLTDDSSRGWAEKYASERNGNVHSFTIDSNARILSAEDRNIDRLSQEERTALAKDYDLIKGKDTLGRTQYVLLNKDVITDMRRENIASQLGQDADHTVASNQLSDPKSALTIKNPDVSVPTPASVATNTDSAVASGGNGSPVKLTAESQIDKLSSNITGKTKMGVSLATQKALDFVNDIQGQVAKEFAVTPRGLVHNEPLTARTGALEHLKNKLVSLDKPGIASPQEALNRALSDLSATDERLISIHVGGDSIGIGRIARARQNFLKEISDRLTIPGGGVDSSVEARVYNPGDTVKVVRADGLVDDGWRVIYKDTDTGRTMVVKDGVGEKWVTDKNLSIAADNPAGSVLDKPALASISTSGGQEVSGNAQRYDDIIEQVRRDDPAMAAEMEANRAARAASGSAPSTSPRPADVSASDRPAPDRLPHDPSSNAIRTDDPDFLAARDQILAEDAAARRPPAVGRADLGDANEPPARESNFRQTTLDSETGERISTPRDAAGSGSSGATAEASGSETGAANPKTPDYGKVARRPGSTYNSGYDKPSTGLEYGKVKRAPTVGAKATSGGSPEVPETSAATDIADGREANPVRGKTPDYGKVARRPGSTYNSGYDKPSTGLEYGKVARRPEVAAVTKKSPAATPPEVPDNLEARAASLDAASPTRGQVARRGGESLAPSESRSPIWGRVDRNIKAEPDIVDKPRAGASGSTTSTSADTVIETKRVSSGGLDLSHLKPEPARGPVILEGPKGTAVSPTGGRGFILDGPAGTTTVPGGGSAPILEPKPGTIAIKGGGRVPIMRTETVPGVSAGGARATLLDPKTDTFDGPGGRKVLDLVNAKAKPPLATALDPKGRIGLVLEPKPGTVPAPGGGSVPRLDTPADRVPAPGGGSVPRLDTPADRVPAPGGGSVPRLDLPEGRVPAPGGGSVPTINRPADTALTPDGKPGKILKPQTGPATDPGFKTPGGSVVNNTLETGTKVAKNGLDRAAGLGNKFMIGEMGLSAIKQIQSGDYAGAAENAGSAVGLQLAPSAAKAALKSNLVSKVAPKVALNLFDKAAGATGTQLARQVATKVAETAVIKGGLKLVPVVGAVASFLLDADSGGNDHLPARLPDGSRIVTDINGNYQLGAAPLTNATNNSYKLIGGDGQGALLYQNKDGLIKKVTIGADDNLIEEDIQIKDGVAYTTKTSSIVTQREATTLSNDLHVNVDLSPDKKKANAANNLIIQASGSNQPLVGGDSVNPVVASSFVNYVNSNDKQTKVTNGLATVPGVTVKQQGEMGYKATALNAMNDRAYGQKDLGDRTVSYVDVYTQGNDGKKVQGQLTVFKDPTKPAILSPVGDTEHPWHVYKEEAQQAEKDNQEKVKASGAGLGVGGTPSGGSGANQAHKAKTFEELKKTATNKKDEGDYISSTVEVTDNNGKGMHAILIEYKDKSKGARLVSVPSASGQQTQYKKFTAEDVAGTGSQKTSTTWTAGTDGAAVVGAVGGGATVVNTSPPAPYHPYTLKGPVEHTGSATILKTVTDPNTGAVQRVYLDGYSTFTNNGKVTTAQLSQTEVDRLLTDKTISSQFASANTKQAPASDGIGLGLGGNVGFTVTPNKPTVTPSKVVPTAGSAMTADQRNSVGSALSGVGAITTPPSVLTTQPKSGPLPEAQRGNLATTLTQGTPTGSTQRNGTVAANAGTVMNDEQRSAVGAALSGAGNIVSPTRTSGSAAVIPNNQRTNLATVLSQGTPSTTPAATKPASYASMSSIPRTFTPPPPPAQVTDGWMGNLPQASATATNTSVEDNNSQNRWKPPQQVAATPMPVDEDGTPIGWSQSAAQPATQEPVPASDGWLNRVTTVGPPPGNEFQAVDNNALSAFDASAHNPSSADAKFNMGHGQLE